MTWALKNVALEKTDFDNAGRITLEFTDAATRVRVFINLPHGETTKEISDRLVQMAIAVEQL